MSHAPHKVQSVYIDDKCEFVPAGVDTKQLRAEAISVSPQGKIYLTLSDYYADEYVVNMGPNTPTMIGFVEMLVANKRFCTIRSHECSNQQGKVFYKPVIKPLPVSVDRFTFL